ncbi:hypothetical protein EBR25_09595 [bacterium]|nr:hypothetical protein [bacterium]
MTNIFTDSHDESPITIIKQTMSVSLSDDGVPMVSFATNRGKGSGAQSMPIAEFADYVSALEAIVESGIPEEENRTYTAAEMVQRTISQTDGVISFRVRDGKGSKPAKIPTDSFSETVELLRSTVDAVKSAGDSLSK